VEVRPSRSGYFWSKVPPVDLGRSWALQAGTANDIGIGADGSVWIIGTNATVDGYGIYRWNGANWYPVDGGAVNVSVDQHGYPWVTNDLGSILQRS